MTKTTKTTSKTSTKTPRDLQKVRNLTFTSPTSKKTFNIVSKLYTDKVQKDLLQSKTEHKKYSNFHITPDNNKKLTYKDIEDNVKYLNSLCKNNKQYISKVIFMNGDNVCIVQNNVINNELDSRIKVIADHGRNLSSDEVDVSETMDFKTYFKNNSENITGFNILYDVLPQGFNSSSNNKCFYNILKQCNYIDDIDEFIEENNLEETVYIEDIDKIEDLIKVNINVYGERFKISDKTYGRDLNIEVYNNHAVLYNDNPLNDNETPFNIALSNKKQYEYLLYVNNKYIDIEGNEYIFDIKPSLKSGIGYKTLNELGLIKMLMKEIYNDEQIEELKKEHSNYIKYFYENTTKENHIKLLNMYIDGLNDLNKEFEEYNKNHSFLFKDPRTVPNLSYYLKNMFGFINNVYKRNPKFNKGFKSYNEFEKIEMNEYKWLNNATKGGLTSKDYDYNLRNNKHLKEDYYVYDMSSSYPSILYSKDFKIPYKRGTFSYISIEEFNNKIKNKELNYGVYRCNINKNNKEGVIPFIFNKDNYYTHYDIYNAYDLGFKIDLMDEFMPCINEGHTPRNINCLIYEENKLVNFKTQYGKLIKGLYHIKSNSITKNKITLIMVKQLLNRIWGLLSQSGSQNKEYYKKFDEIELEDNEIIIDTMIDNEGELTGLIKNLNELTATRYYRLKPFLLSRQRKVMAYFINKYQADIYKCDSFGIHKDREELNIDELNKVIEKELNIKDIKGLGYFKLE